MTALLVPLGERNILRLVDETASSQPDRVWTPLESRMYLGWCAGLVERFRELRRKLDQTLTDGVESTSFQSQFGAYAKECEDLEEPLSKLIATLEQSTNSVVPQLLPPSRELLEAISQFHSFLSEAHALASAPRTEPDWGRVRAAEEAYRQGQTKQFDRCR